MTVLSFSVASCKNSDDAFFYYPVIIASNIENGTVTADKTSAASGQTVTLTAIPDDGYELESFIVTDSSSQAITVTENAFVMPTGIAIVSATFVLSRTTADDVITLINAIGTVAYTSDSKTKIDAARTAYDALTSDQKAQVTNYETLTTAESTYSSFAVSAVIGLISDIGTVAYTSDSKAKIDAARTAYDALTEAQQAQVTNYETLTTAESTYRSLTPVSINGSGFSVTTWENEPGDNLGTE
ncbi:MAG: hypothetical protein K6G80_11495 [Treponema sp.]|nr:hypothetical protein [Treponema sp.]